MSKNKLFVEFGSASWIRSWFMRQDDFTLWCIGFVWLINSLAVLSVLITIFLTVLV